MQQQRQQPAGGKLQRKAKRLHRLVGGRSVRWARVATEFVVDAFKRLAAGWVLVDLTVEVGHFVFICEIWQPLQF